MYIFTIIQCKNTLYLEHSLHELLKIFTKSLAAWPLADIVLKEGMMLGCKYKKNYNKTNVGK